MAGTNGADVVGLFNRGSEATPDWLEVGFQTSLSMSRSQADIDFSNKVSGRAIRRVAGRYQASLQLDAFYVDGDAGLEIMEDSVNNGTLIDFLIRIAGSDHRRCKGYVSQLDGTFPDQAPSTISCTINVDGFIGPA